MTVVPQSTASVSRSGNTGNLYDILELILDRGLVIDVFIRVSLVGIEILKIDIRIVVASVDTYLRFAEACNRLDLESGRKAPAQLTDIVGEVTEGGARGKSKGRSPAPSKPSPTPSTWDATTTTRTRRSPSRNEHGPPAAHQATGGMTWPSTSTPSPLPRTPVVSTAWPEWGSPGGATYRVLRITVCGRQ